jgi:hypothetical protein
MPVGIVVLIIALTIVSSLQAETVNPSNAQAEGMKDTVCGFTLCPPGPVSDKIEVEIRLGIKNQTSEDQSYEVVFYLDKKTQKNIIHKSSVRVGAGNNQLVSKWLLTNGRIGKNKIYSKVESDGKIIDEASWELEVFPSDTSALPWAQGIWLDPGALISSDPKDARLTPDDIRTMVDSMRDIGMTVIIISYVEAVVWNGGVFYPSKIEELGKQQGDFDIIGVIMDQAARNGQHVMLGLGRGKDMTLVYDGVKDPQRVAKALDIGRKVARELWDRYSHYPSFYGWYLSHEPSDLTAANIFLNPITDYMHQMAPEKLVMLAPNGTPILTPAILYEGHYDIITYQDAVGPGYVPYVYTWNPENRMAMLSDVCTSYRAAHYGTKKHLWSDTETWEMTGPEYKNPYAASFSRLIRQIKIQKQYFQMLTMYEFMQTMSPPALKVASKDERAHKLYAEYQKYYKSEYKKASRKSAILQQKQVNRIY